MAEFEFGGMTFRGGKMMVVLTALSTLGAGAWGAFEFYKDYMDMREIVQNIDTTEIENRNKVIETKLDEAIEYTRDIKDDLKSDIRRIEAVVESVERSSKETVRDVNEDLRGFKQDMRDLEKDLTEKLQEALDNPLNDMK